MTVERGRIKLLGALVAGTVLATVAPQVLAAEGEPEDNSWLARLKRRRAARRTLRLHRRGDHRFCSHKGGGQFEGETDDVSSVPEPGTLGLLGAGLVAIGLANKFGRKKI